MTSGGPRGEHRRFVKESSYLASNFLGSQVGATSTQNVHIDCSIEGCIQLAEADFILNP